MQFNLRSKKLEIKPVEIEAGKSYLFIVENIYNGRDFENVRKALGDAISAFGVKGVIVTKPMTPATVEMVADVEHQQWISWTHAIVDQYGDKLPAELVEQWKAKWVAYDQLPEADKELDRIWARKLVEESW